MTNFEKTIVGIIVLALCFIGYRSSLAPSSDNPNFRGTSMMSSLIPSGAIVHTSSSVTTNGVVIITDAQNVGRYVSAVNTSGTRVWCGFSTNTSTIWHGAWLLSPVTSSTGQTGYVWEFVDGPFSCISDGTVEVDIAYVNQ